VRAHTYGIRRSIRSCIWVLCFQVSLPTLAKFSSHASSAPTLQSALSKVWLTVLSCPQLFSRRSEAARGLPVVQSSLDQALQQHQDHLLQQQAPAPSCTPAQGASHNGVALPNLHIEAEFRFVTSRSQRKVMLMLPSRDSASGTW
jgi:hypothetical protein